MTIYSQDVKKSKKTTTPKTPPHREEINSSTVSLRFANQTHQSVQAPQTSQEIVHSELVPINGISDKEISDRLQETFPQWAELIGRNQETFQKFANLVNDGLKERVDREKASQGANISVFLVFIIQLIMGFQSILTQDFEYSDDEDEVKQKSEFNIPRDKIDR